MSKPRFDSPEALLRRFAEGRGSGEGRHFKSWLTTLDVTRYGTRRQMFSALMGCPLHVLSFLEAALVLVLEWAVSITSLKVQVPLPLEDTIKVALSTPYQHPSAQNGFPVVMTTDAVATFEERGRSWQVGFCAKYEKDLRDQRVLEKLEIERLTWRNVLCNQWFVVRETDLPSVLVENLRWVRSRMRPGILDYLGGETILAAEGWMRPRAIAGKSPIAAVASECDRKLAIAAGSSLSIVRYLIATRAWRVDLISRRILPSTDCLVFDRSDL